MRKIFVVIFLIPFLFAFSNEEIKQYAIEHNVTCRQGITSCTVMWCGSPYYNEKGEYIIPKDCNSCTTFWECSDGKTFSTSDKENPDEVKNHSAIYYR